MKYKEIVVAIAIFLWVNVSSPATLLPTAQLNDTRQALILDKPLTGDLLAHPFFWHCAKNMDAKKLSSKDRDDFFDQYRNVGEITLPFLYCDDTRDLQNTVFVQQTKYVVIEKGTRAVTGPLCPCIVVAASYPPFDSCLVMHVFYLNKLSEVVKEIVSFVPDQKKVETKVMIYTQKHDPRVDYFSSAEEDEGGTACFVDEEEREISQKDAIKTIKDGLEINGFSRVLMKPTVLSAGAEWDRPLLASGSEFFSAQKSVVVSYDDIKQEWSLRSVCLGTEMFLKKDGKQVSDLSEDEYSDRYSKYCGFIDQVSKMTDPEDIKFYGDHGYTRVAKQDPPRLVKSFLP